MAGAEEDIVVMRLHHGPLVPVAVILGAAADIQLDVLVLVAPVLDDAVEQRRPGRIRLLRIENIAQVLDPVGGLHRIAVGGQIKVIEDVHFLRSLGLGSHRGGHPQHKEQGKQQGKQQLARIHETTPPQFSGIRTVILPCKKMHVNSSGERLFRPSGF